MTAEHIRTDEEYYLVASASIQRRAQVLLNHDESFVIFDLTSDIPLARREAYGLFHCGTRFLSRYELRLNGQFPLLLSTAMIHEGSGLVTYLSNADEVRQGEVVLLRDTVAVRRDKTLFAGTLYERIHLLNFGQETLSLELRLLYGADFADIFELRGTQRARRGEVLAPSLRSDRLHLFYQGLDGVRRETELSFSPAPSYLAPDSASFALRLAPGEETALGIAISCHVGHAAVAPVSTFTAALDAVVTGRDNWRARFPHVSASHESFNAWVNRSLHDLALLRVNSPQGSYVSEEFLGSPRSSAVTV